MCDIGNIKCLNKVVSFVLFLCLHLDRSYVFDSIWVLDLINITPVG